MNVIVHDDFDGITVSDPTMGNVAPCNMSFLPPNSGYMPRVNLFTYSSSFDNDNSHFNSNNLPSMEVVSDSDGLMGKNCSVRKSCKKCFLWKPCRNILSKKPSSRGRIYC